MDNKSIFNDIEGISLRFTGLLNSDSTLLDYLGKLGIGKVSQNIIFAECISAFRLWFEKQQVSDSGIMTKVADKNSSAEFGGNLARMLHGLKVELRDAHELLKRLRWACLDFWGSEKMEESQRTIVIASLHNFWDNCEMVFCSEWLQLSDNLAVFGQKKEEKQFRKMEELKDAMLYTTLQSIVHLSPDGEVVMLNKTAERWIKQIYGHEVMKGDSAFFFLHLRDIESFGANFRKALKGEIAGGEWSTEDQSGKVYWYALDYLPIWENYSVSGVCFCAMDITDRKRLEEEITHRQKEAAKQGRLLQRKNIAFSELIEHTRTERLLVERKISNNIEQIVLPIVSSLKLAEGERREEYARLLESSLRDLLSSKGSRIAQPELGLTPREIQICEMIKQGFSSREIAKLLGIGIRSIDSHRYNIRKKLGLKDRSTKLVTYLKSL